MDNFAVKRMPKVWAVDPWWSAKVLQVGWKEVILYFVIKFEVLIKCIGGFRQDSGDVYPLFWSQLIYHHFDAGL